MTLPKALANQHLDNPNDLDEAAQVAVAAVLRALPECEAVEEAVRATVYDGNMAQAHRIARRVLVAIAELADDE